MTYAAAIEFLLGLRQFGAKLGLENPRRLAALAGHPEARLRFIHVAGTNGKGSTCAMLESIYRAAGLRVGLFTSPHLVSFAERIQVNRRLIPEGDVARLTAEIHSLLPAFGGGHWPTFFEVVTVMALKYFAEQHCDLVVWETGLGGRLDATNIVTPLASVITNIQFDHERWLGHTLAEIAAEKAGIIKPGLPVITGATAPEALAVIRATAAERGSPLTVVTETDAASETAGRTLPLAGAHQRHNAALALATVRVLQPTLPVAAPAIAAGLAQAQWPGRMQRVARPGGGLLLLDGAHNPAGIAALGAALREQFPGQRAAFIVGVMEDKDWAAMSRLLAPLASGWWLVPVASARGLPPDRAAVACRAAAPEIPLRECASLAGALQATAAEPLTVVAGSLYLVGQALELLGQAAAPAADEKPLNEWTGGGSGRG